MQTTRLDAIVLGSGQAGPTVAVRLAKAGLKTALVERKHLGGTCVNDGCTPTKALVASARAAYMARRAADFGVTIGGAVGVDMKAVKSRKDAVVAESVSNLTRWIEDTDDLELVWGEARFVGPQAVAVGDRRLEAPRIFINVGGRPVVPALPGLDGVPYLTSVSMMSLDELPAHLVIMGGSYVGLEFAQMYRRFGSEVTVVEHGARLIEREDEEVSREVQAILEREGVRFVLQARDGRVAASSGGIHVQVTGDGAAHTLDASHLLLAVGRKPNSDTLDLARAGIATDARGYITVDDQLRTSVPGVWALGDVNGRGAFTHTAYNDGEIVLANVLDGEARRVSERIAAYALYTDPPLGRVGMTEAQVRQDGRRALVATMPMSRVARARERSETQGFMKVVVDAGTQRILGAALLGIEADEVVHTLLDVMAADAPYRVLQRTMHIHPTVSELIPTLLGGLQPLH